MSAPDRPFHDPVDLSVVVPAYNESARLQPTLVTVRDYLSHADLSWELIVVDDGSTDDTPDIVKRAGDLSDRIRLLQLPQNRGKGCAVRSGVLDSQGRLVLLTDADLSTPIDELERLRAALPGRVAAIGSRALARSRIEVHQGHVREALGRLGNTFIRLLAVPHVVDTQCGFKLFDGARARRLFSLAHVDGWAFDVEILHLCHRFGWPVVEVPVRWAHADGSTIRPGAYAQVLRDVLGIRWRYRGRNQRGAQKSIVDLRARLSMQSAAQARQSAWLDGSQVRRSAR